MHYKKSKNTRGTKDKKRLRVALKLLEAVKTEYPENKKFIQSVMDEECQKENISADEVIFLHV